MGSYLSTVPCRIQGDYSGLLAINNISQEVMIRCSLNSAFSTNHVIFQYQHHGAGCIIVYISNLRTLKLDEENPLIQGHPAVNGRAGI